MESFETSCQHTESARVYFECFCIWSNSNPKPKIGGSIYIIIVSSKISTEAVNLISEYVENFPRKENTNLEPDNAYDDDSNNDDDNDDDDKDNDDIDDDADNDDNGDDDYDDDY